MAVIESGVSFLRDAKGGCVARRLRMGGAVGGLWGEFNGVGEMRIKSGRWRDGEMKIGR